MKNIKYKDFERTIFNFTTFQLVGYILRVAVDLNCEFGSIFSMQILGLFDLLNSNSVGLFVILNDGINENEKFNPENWFYAQQRWEINRTRYIYSGK